MVNQTKSNPNLDYDPDPSRVLYMEMPPTFLWETPYLFNVIPVS